MENILQAANDEALAEIRRRLDTLIPSLGSSVKSVTGFVSTLCGVIEDVSKSPNLRKTLNGKNKAALAAAVADEFLKKLQTAQIIDTSMYAKIRRVLVDTEEFHGTIDSIIAVAKSPEMLQAAKSVQSCFRFCG